MHPPLSSRPPALAQADVVLAKLQQLIAVMAQAGRRDDPHFQGLRVAYQELMAELKTARIVSTSVVADPPANVVEGNGRQALAGLPLLKETLGPAGRPGVVSYGPSVQHLQQILVALGFVVPTTSAYDARIHAAVRDFQARHRLHVTGIVGAETRAALNRFLVAPTT